MINHNKLSDQVEWALKVWIDARNDDCVLTQLVWKKFYCDYLRSDEFGEATMLPLQNLKKVPSQDAISRVRRKFNEQGQYLPTDPKIIKDRNINECLWRGCMVNEFPSKFAMKNRELTKMRYAKPQDSGMMTKPVIKENPQGALL